MNDAEASQYLVSEFVKAAGERDILAEALVPFAKLGRVTRDHHFSGDEIISSYFNGKKIAITYGDLSDAATAFAMVDQEDLPDIARIDDA